ncbi:MAG: Ger(x)C family spore germination protein [Oscillospiraceae bacterium]|nr:Ger(x)C family spore germination protein [Oscillospiraceae bacterium]
MKRFILYILIVCMPVLSACGDVNIYSAHSEPEELAVIKTVGIDYSDGVVEVTATTGIGADGKKAKTYSSTADTLAEAINGIQNGYLGDEAYFSHVQQIIIGEAALQNGITEVLDYVGRNVYMQLSSDLYLAKGGTAKKLMEDTTGESTAVSDMLEAISKKSEFMAAGKVFTCKDVMASLAKSGMALIYVIEAGEPLYTGGDDETLSVKPMGYAIIKDGKLEEYLDTGVTEGAGIIMGHTKSGMLTVEAEGHGAVTLKISNIKTDLEPIFESGKLTTVTVKVTAELNIEESAEDLNYLNESFREKVERAAAVEIEETVQAVLLKSAELGEDFCGMGDKLYLKHPYKLADEHDNWEKVYENLQFKTEIRAKLERTYDMENSLNYTGEKNGEG